MKPSVILVSPKGSANVGSVARLMGNFGLNEMRLVSPRCQVLDEEGRRMSLEAQPLIRNAKTFETFSEAQRDLSWTVAISMRIEAASTPAFEFTDFFENVLPKQNLDLPWGFVFGREDNGLELDELRGCNFQVRIPSEEPMNSLNLASAAAVTLFEWYRKSSAFKMLERGSFKPPLKFEEELFFDSLRELLHKVGFMKGYEGDYIMGDIRNFYRRGEPSERDLKILFGILSDIYRTGQFGRIRKPSEGQGT